MPRVSVLTPVDPDRATFLGDAARSVARQAVPPGWEVEWCVQVDGPDAEAVIAAIGDAGVAVAVAANGRRFGAAVMRNLALARATGDWIAPLDADDELAEGALSACAGAVARWPEARWVALPYLDLMPDGTFVEFPLACDEGWVEPGRFAFDGDWPWVGAGGWLRADVLRAVGGWAAIPRSEDLPPWCTIVACFGGVYLHTVGGHYRQWERQTSADQRWMDDTEQFVALVRAQVDALRRIGGLPPPSSRPPYRRS